jgi:GntR family transcriptional repressor for pyruvate dehydrogenase complex
MDTDPKLYNEITLVRGQLYEQIADAIQALVVDQKIQPGERLPPERELAAALNVSRPTIREALRLLQSRGLLLRKPGYGTYVTALSPDSLVKTMERFFFIADCSYDDLMQVRVLLEPATSALAAQKATDQQIEWLGEKLATIEGRFEARAVDEYASADSQFHVAIAEASGNTLLAAVAAGIDHLVRKWNELSAAEIFDEQVMKSHRSIFEAIKDRDADQAHNVMLAHIHMSQSIFPPALKELHDRQNRLLREDEGL